MITGDAKNEMRFHNECSVQLKEKITWLSDTITVQIHWICREVKSESMHYKADVIINVMKCHFPLYTVHID